ncbi:Alpha/Beta hydrolase protein [Fimicolochytrium jonesii]|uniref:Alpha/Beta hydrolase protein n=1 Tax=Fimicolochytrium jonesii TaxID=1396493 RepID=UPI0022FE66FD|nr:Alpha/Beta hydrolase protein [Fimicolochytrium jonesii]KAI8819598.1 Alpha/Beta hydrolase protein [Fimicolochytrium jonesii]
MSTHPTLSFQRFSPPTGTARTSISPLVILHGLFGSKQNWRSLSKALASKLGTDVIPVDLRNHGESFHDARHDFETMAEDVREFLETEGLGKVNLVGHSMGGKVAMHYALQDGSRLDKLIVVDMAPAKQRQTKEFGGYVNVMKKVEAAKVTSKDQADKIMEEDVKDLSIRQFLLTNLRRTPGDPHMTFRINLPALEESLESLWRFSLAGSGKTHDGPALFIAGTKARYITEESRPVIKEFFPRAVVVDVDAGHWVHAEKPEEFLRLVTAFLTDSVEK